MLNLFVCGGREGGGNGDHVVIYVYVLIADGVFLTVKGGKIYV